MFFLFTVVGMSTDITNPWGNIQGPSVSTMNNAERAGLNISHHPSLTT
jgi:hypothetical protein